MYKKAFSAAWQIKDLFARCVRHFARNGGWERFRFVGKAHCLPNFNSHTNGRLAFTKCTALSSSFAFTLAEVLITLAIIGVVAALTIPAVVKNYRNTQYKTQFKKMYATIQNAYQKTVFDFGYMPKCYYDIRNPKYELGDCDAFYKQLEENLKIAKKCNGNALSGGCIPEYFNYATDDSGCPGFTKNSINNIDIVYVLADGTILIRYVGNYPLFLFDINGKNLPNKGGYDLFGFRFVYDSLNPKTIIENAGSCLPVAEGGRLTTEMLKWVYQ